MAVDIPFPTSTSPGTREQEAGGRIINGYVEPLQPGAPTGIVYRRAPGLAAFGTSTRTGCRGLFRVGGILYAAFDGYLELFTAAGGASTAVGTLFGSAKGFFARNNAPGADIVFCDPEGNVGVLSGSTLTNGYPDGDLPVVNSVCSIDGYLVFTTGQGKAYASELNSLEVNALSFATAESKPDGLVRAIPYGGQLFLFGGFTTEIWTNVGSVPFPFRRSAIIPRGLAGSYCIAGYEDNFGHALVWIGDDNAVYRLNGYTPEKVSPPDLDGLIEAVDDKQTLEVSVYISRGHAFVLVSSETWSWVLDLNSIKWAERQSYQLQRSRITGGVNAFGKWLCGDTESGNILEITSEAREEVGDPFRFRLESGAVEKFPVGARVGRADFNFVTGVGDASGLDPQETDPSVEISWSDDGGQTYSSPIVRELGQQSRTLGLVSLVACTGRSSWNGRRWRIDVADPVHVGFFGATQSETGRA